MISETEKDKLEMREKNGLIISELRAELAAAK